MSKVKYNIGDTINGFKFLSEPIEITPRKGVFICKYCNNEFTTRVHSIASGHANSCGCKSDYLGAIKRTKHGHNSKYGKKSSEYLSWTCMLDRCYRKSHHAYAHYNGLGITVCDRWRHSFVNFLEDMGLKPTSKHTLDRFPNESKIYSKETCRWATKKEQSDNRVNVKPIELNGKIQSLARWSEELNVPYDRLKNRIQRGFTPQEAITVPYIPRVKKSLSK